MELWFEMEGDAIASVTIEFPKPKDPPKDPPKPLPIDPRYAYLEPLWQEWIEAIGKVVPTDNRYYNLTHGITEEALKKGSRMEKGIDIPDELANFYKIRDVKYDGISAAFGFSTVSWEYDLMPFKKIATDWNFIQDLGTGDPEDMELDDFSPKVKADDYANPKWIPFAEDYEGNYLLYDTDPSKAGTYGQIVELKNESWERNVVADSLSELLRKDIDSIKSGNLKRFDFILEKMNGVP
jgi:cell wall assembly regulator SMI1